MLRQGVTEWCGEGRGGVAREKRIFERLQMSEHRECRTTG